MNARTVDHWITLSLCVASVNVRQEAIADAEPPQEGSSPAHLA